DSAVLPSGKEVWIGQLAEKEKGLYAAMDAEWKYVYSAPDDAEYLIHRGEGEGPACDARECEDHVGEAGARGVLERLRGALQERLRRDGYTEPLAPGESHGWRRYPAPKLAWEPLDEMEDRSTVARGWQYARWNKGGELDRRVDPAKGAYGFGV
ncbi:MAG TPA: hypothetical protein VFX49_09865, partial [Chloroflexota bacterium]|nr:hypothetical protein [Chloroflexota bacterium]